MRSELSAFVDRIAVSDVSMTPSRIKTELLSGLTVALALVPEAVAFAFVAGVHPLVGLYAAFIVGLVTALFGGRPGMISGATGALAVAMVSLVAQHGVEYLFATVVLMGIIQIAAGLFHLGRFIRLVPHPVMLGFVNGLAIVIFLAQLGQFKVAGPDGTLEWMQGLQLYTMLGLVGLTMVVIWLAPKITTAFPAPLAAILFVAALVIAFGLDSPRVGDLASIEGGLPMFHIPELPLTFESLKIILPYAFILAAIGLIESLLTLNLVGEITGKRGGASKECLAQGGANLITGFFGGMGGCAMIGQSLINVSSGARARLSGIVAAVMLLVFILFGAPLIEQLPMAALTGLMIMVAIGTFEWASLRTFRRMPTSDVIIMVLVTGITAVLHNLALAVLIGVIVAALIFAWDNAIRIRARKRTDEKGWKHYELFGPLFFGSTTVFQEKFDVQGDPEHVVLDFAESRVSDMSAIEAVNKVTARYAAAGKTVHLRHLSKDCRRLLDRADAIIEVNHFEDPTYKVVTDATK